jgi:putative proteasome-type protease
MDSTLRSNISVGFPLDLLVYERDALSVGRFVTVDERNQYFQMIRSTWGQQLKNVFEGIPDPVWNAALNTEANVLSSAANHNQPVRVQPPNTVAKLETKTTQLQTLAQQDQRGQPQ